MKSRLLFSILSVFITFYQISLSGSENNITLGNDKIKFILGDSSFAIETYGKYILLKSDKPIFAVNLNGRDIGISSENISIKKENKTTAILTINADKRLLSLKIIWDGDKLSFYSDPVQGMQPDDVLELTFPKGIADTQAGDEGYFILPLGLGKLCDFSSDRPSFTINDFIYSNAHRGYTMPCFGVSKKAMFATGIINAPFDCRLRTLLNVGGRYRMDPVWVYEGNRINYRREVSYYFKNDGSYVDVAKIYRNELIRSGKFVTLKSKSASWSKHYAGAVSGLRNLFISDMKEADLCGSITSSGILTYAWSHGFDRINLWTQGPLHRHLYGGMDPHFGSIDELGKFCKKANAYTDYRLGTYDNYIDRYPVSPEWNTADFQKEKNMKLQNGWHSDQMDMTAGRVCSSVREQKAALELQGLYQKIGKGCIYIDVEGCLGLLECFDPMHIQTRQNDCENRNRLLTEARRIFGAVATESTPLDCLVKSVDIGACFPVTIARFQKLNLITVPLFGLVYHDSVMEVNPAKKYGMLGGEPLYIPLYGMLPATLDNAGLRTSYELRDSYFQEMKAHMFLTKSKDVQMTEFANGTTVIANFNKNNPYEYRGKMIASDDFIITGSNVDIDITPSSCKLLPDNLIDLEVTLAGYGTEILHDLHFSLAPAIPSKNMIVKITPEEAVVSQIKPGEIIKLHFQLKSSSVFKSPSQIVLIGKLAYLDKDCKQEISRIKCLEALPELGLTPGDIIRRGNALQVYVDLKNNMNKTSEYKLEFKSNGKEKPVPTELCGELKSEETKTISTNVKTDGDKEEGLSCILSYRTEDGRRIEAIQKIILNKEWFGNGGFEDGFNHWGTPLKLLKDKSSLESYAIDTKKSFSGTNSIRVTTPLSGAVESRVAVGFSLLGGMTLSVWSKAESYPEKNLKYNPLRMKIIYGDYEKTEWLESKGSAFESGKDWAKTSIYYIPKKNQTIYFVHPHLDFPDFKGHVWFDEFSLKIDGIALPVEYSRTSTFLDILNPLNW